MQVGTTEGQGLYNKPSAVVHPGALGAGALPQYSTIRCIISQKSVDLNSIPQYEKTAKSKTFRYGLTGLNTSKVAVA